MAQRTIHYLFGEMIAAQVEIKDKARFLLGSIMPDAIDVKDRDASHFKVRTETYDLFDFDAFRKRYADRMLQDDLYLGYCMHLVEDAFYRTFVYGNGYRMPQNMDEVKLLHNDYHILNDYIVRKFSLHNILTENTVSDAEPIYEIAKFHLDTFLDEMANDFTEQTEGCTVFLTESMLDEFVETYLPLAVKEVHSLKNGTGFLKASDYAYRRRV